VELYLDDRKTDIEADSQATLGQVLDELKRKLAGTERIIVSLHCDGNDATGEAFQENLAKLSGDFERIDMRSAEMRIVVAEALHSVGTMLDQAADAATEIVNLMSGGKLAEAMPKLGDCCQVWSQIHEALYNAALMLGLDLDTFQVQDRPLPDVLAIPTDKLEQLREVLQARDFVLLADILHYEFDEVIQSWRQIKDALIETIQA